MKPPCPVLVQRDKLNPFRNYHCFNYQRQCLRSKIKFVWGCGASRECGRISISNSKGLLYYFKGLSWAHLDIKIVLTIRANVWEQKKSLCGGCGASRQYESISISKNKAPPLLLQMVNSSPFRHYHCFYYHIKFQNKNKVCVGMWW